MATRYSKEKYARIKVLRESLRLTTYYLNREEKVVVANSILKSVEVESLKLMKDLIEAMDEIDKVKEKIKELSEELRVKKMLVIQNDEGIQVALLRTDAKCEKFIQYYKGLELLCEWTMKHHNQVMDFSNLDFEAIDTEVLAEEAKEQKETTIVTAGGEGATDAGGANPG
nr:hypothetical protein CFP56_23741 [Quercus suber]